jgi:hypothetical protein
MLKTLDGIVVAAAQDAHTNRIHSHFIRRLRMTGKPRGRLTLMTLFYSRRDIIVAIDMLRNMQMPYSVGKWLSLGPSQTYLLPS